MGCCQIQSTNFITPQERGEESLPLQARRSLRDLFRCFGVMSSINQQNDLYAILVPRIAVSHDGSLLHFLFANTEWELTCPGSVCIIILKIRFGTVTGLIARWERYWGKLRTLWWSAESTQFAGLGETRLHASACKCVARQRLTLVSGNPFRCGS
jgi:hypothetical protein